MKETGIKLRASARQRDLLSHAAALQGKSRADFILEAACEQANALVLNQVLINLDAGRFRQFAELLDSPIGSNPGLKKLLALKAPWNERSELAPSDSAEVLEDPRTIG